MKGTKRRKNGKHFRRPSSWNSTTLLPPYKGDANTRSDGIHRTGMGQGRFTCGGQGHGFRQYPKSTTATTGRFEKEVGEAACSWSKVLQPPTWWNSVTRWPARATETVGSFGAIQQVPQKRFELTGVEGFAPKTIDVSFWQRQMAQFRELATFCCLSTWESKMPSGETIWPTKFRP